MRAVAKVVALPVAGLVAAAAACAALFLVNAADVPLDTRARAALDARHDTVPRADNAYFAIRDLDEPPATRFEGSKDVLCGGAAPAEDCVERARARSGELAAVVDANRVLLERYQGLSGYAHFQNPVQLTQNAPILQWQPFLSAKRLFLTALALEAGAGHVDAAVDALARDIVFTRRLLADQDMLLIDKLVLATSARHSLLFSADLVRSGVLNEGQYARLAAVLAPPGDRERSLAGVFAREFTGVAAVLAMLRDDPTWSARFFKYNDSLNREWSWVEHNQGASDGACADLAAREAALERAARIPWYRYVYDPVGKLVTRVPQAGQYLRFMCDLEGMYGIVALQLDMRLRHVAAADVAAFVQRAPPRSRNPYTREPFGWNAAERAVVFAPTAERDRKYFPWKI